MVWQLGLAVFNNGSIGVEYGSEFMSVYYDVSTLLACIQKVSAWVPLIGSFF
jgi:hypothetical protein